MTYFINMIMSCKQSYFLIRMGVHFPRSTSRTQQSPLLAVLLQVMLACFSYLLVRMQLPFVLKLISCQNDTTRKDLNCYSNNSFSN